MVVICTGTDLQISIVEGVFNGEMLVVFGDDFLLGWLRGYGLGGAEIMDNWRSKLHVEDWRRPELLKFRDLDPRRRSSFVFSLLFGKRALLVLGLDGVGNLGVDLGQGVVDEGEEVLGDVLELRRLVIERRGGIELLGLGLSLSALVGLA